ncbi:hypothetical protein A2U01_0066467, partial [Trifolium medium]|nr:hypothetical protein [Trifolium medium]
TFGAAGAPFWNPGRGLSSKVGFAGQSV